MPIRPLIPHIRTHFDALADRLATFNHHEFQVEGWFKGELIHLLHRDAARLGIRDGDKVRVATRRGEVTACAHVAGKVRPGGLWMPFHYLESSTNLLTNDAFDNITRTAEYKVCAARIECL